MLIFFIALTLFLASLGGIAILFARKFPLLASLNTNTVDDEKEMHVKTALLEQRLRRRVFSFLEQAKDRLLPVLKWISDRYRIVAAWAHALEERYQRTLELERARVSPALLKSPDTLLGEAAADLERGMRDVAEHKLLAIVTQDPHSLPAFKLLARLYGEKKEFDHVREIDEFLLRLDAHQADVYADLSAALLALGDSTLALDAAEKAVEIEEENPKYLDQLLELAILLKRKTLAAQTLVLLENTNPENEKIPVFAQRIRDLPRS